MIRGSCGQVAQVAAAVECRICGFGFAPSVSADRAAHEQQKCIVAEAAPQFRVRELLKAFGPAAAHHDDGLRRLEGKFDRDVGVLAVALDPRGRRRQRPRAGWAVELEDGQGIRTVQELLGHRDLKTTMVYTHLLNLGPAGVRSPLDRL
jgi:hypothetical protein